MFLLAWIIKTVFLKENWSHEVILTLFHLHMALVLCDVAWIFCFPCQNSWLEITKWETLLLSLLVKMFFFYWLWIALASSSGDLITCSDEYDASSLESLFCNFFAKKNLDLYFKRSSQWLCVGWCPFAGDFNRSLLIFWTRLKSLLYSFVGMIFVPVLKS